MNAATTYQQVAKLLLELEVNIKWAAVDSRWKDRREAWAAGLISGQTNPAVLKSISVSDKNHY